MKKAELEDKILELESKIFDLNRELEQQKIFVELGDQKLIKAYEKVDKGLEKINQIKSIL